MTITFIGGGNMASAIAGGLVARGRPASGIAIVDPVDSQRAKLEADPARPRHLLTETGVGYRFVP